MIDRSQWHASIGYFNSRVNCYVNREFISNTNNVVLLHAVVTVMRDVAVLQTYMYIVTVLLLLCCGDIEMNPGSMHKVCPNCNIHYNIRKKSCKCGYVFYKRSGRKTGSTRSAGFSASPGRPWPTSNVNVDLDVPMGRPVSNVDFELDVPIGRPASNINIELDVPIGRPASSVNIELDVSTGRPLGTTCDAGFNVSTSHPVSAEPSKTNMMQFANNVVKETEFHDDSYDACSTTGLVEDNASLLTEYMKQYNLPSAWDTNKTNLSDDL